MNEGPMRLGVRRSDVLQHAANIVEQAWVSFDEARPTEPELSEAMMAVLQEALPSRTTNPIVALDEAHAILEHSLAQSRPRFFAYVGSSGLEIGAVADLLAHSYDVNLALDARAATLLEQQAVRWLADFMEYPAASGWFTSGGTVSNLNALVAAREQAVPGVRSTGVASRRLALYCSEEAHYSVKRAAEILGIGTSSVRLIPTAPFGRALRVDVLEDTIVRDRAEGVTPIAVVATAGTTLTGAVDPIDAIADVCDRHRIWLHVDGAYGLPAVATSRRDLFSGLSRADSVAVDAHKWLFVPKACSVLLVRQPSSFISALGHDEAYVPHEGEMPNAVDVTLEYSRPLRALKLWMAFRVHGSQEMRDALEANLAQADHCYDLADQHGELEVLPFRPPLSIVPFRHVVPGCPDLDEHNLRLTEAIQADGGAYVSPATIDGAKWLRPCFTNIRTSLGDVDAFLDKVVEIGRDLCPSHCESRGSATHAL